MTYSITEGAAHQQNHCGPWWLALIVVAGRRPNTLLTRHAAWSKGQRGCDAAPARRRPLSRIVGAQMGFEGTAKLWQRSCTPIPAGSRWGDPTMPPHDVKVSGPRGLKG